MNRLAQPLALIAGLGMLVVALAALVREVALAADDTLTWTTPSWWLDLTGHASAATTVAAAVATVLTVLCVVLGARQFMDPGSGDASRIGAGEGAALSVAALERLLARRLRDAVSGIDPVGVRLRRADEGWRALVVADLVPEDLAKLQAEAAGVADAELRQAAGEGLATLELEARRLVRAGR